MRKLTISPIRIASLQRLSPREQYKRLSAFVRTPVLIELHRLQATDTMCISKPVEVLVTDYPLERGRFEKIETVECSALPQGVVRSYYEWLYGGEMILATLLQTTIRKFQQEHSCKPRYILVAEENEEEAKTLLQGEYCVFGRKQMPIYAALAESSVREEKSA